LVEHHHSLPVGPVGLDGQIEEDPIYEDDDDTGSKLFASSDSEDE